VSTIEITEQGGEQVARLFQRLTSAANDFTPLMRAVAGTLADETEQNFADQGRPSWVPLAEITLKKRRDPKRKKKEGPPRFGSGSHMILQDAGHLAASISGSYSRDFAVIGSSAVYARIHQLGGQAGKNHAVTIPARPYFHVSQEGWDAISDAVGRFIANSVR